MISDFAGPSLRFSFRDEGDFIDIIARLPETLNVVRQRHVAGFYKSQGGHAV
jgi:hypothetical protein